MAASPVSDNFKILSNLSMFDPNDITCSVQDENKILVKLLNKSPQGSVFVDVGAYKGDTCVPVARMLQKHGRHDILIVAIEPSKYNADIIKMVTLRENLKIKVVCAAAGDNDRGTVSIVKHSEKGPGQMYSPDINGNIPMITLDKILKGLSVWLLKIDVEGMEDLVLKGSYEILKMASYVYVEMWSDDHYLRRFGSKKEHVKSIVFQLTPMYIPLRHIDKNILYMKKSLDPESIKDII